MLFDHLYQSRSWLASMPSLLIIALALFWTSQVTPLKQKTKPTPPMQLRMVTLPAPEPVIPPQHAPVTPVRPEQSIKPAPAKTVTTTAPAPIAAPIATVAAPSKTTPPTTQPTNNTVAESAPIASPKHVAETPPLPPAPVSVNLEAGYIAKLRTYIESSKRYPTGREASLMRPAGMVRIWLELDRSGHLLDSGIEQSSHSMLLDHAALSTVRRGEYPSFPADVWTGSTSHRFTVDLNYTPAS